MDKTTLVRTDLETRGQIQNALSLAKIPVSLVEVDYLPQLDEWQVFVATRLYDNRGPREAVSKVIKALQDAGIYKDVPIRKVFVKSPDDPLIKDLETEIKVRTEGAIHILSYTRSSQPEMYSVIFAPFAGPGGAVPSRRFPDSDQLRAFLEDAIGVSRSSVDEAFSELKRKGSSSIFHVQLTRRQARTLGLA
ncbi:MAG: hypothetical protein WB711_17065 [Terriglobales bacterium]